MDGLKRQFEDIRRDEAARARVLEGLLEQVETLQAKYDESQDELQRSKYLCKSYESDIRDLKKQNEKLLLRMSAQPFVLVCIDGDNTLFGDEYVKKGYDGGLEAARTLRTELFQYLGQSTDYQPHWRMIVRVYVKQSGLSKTYLNAGVLSDVLTWLKFVAGFNAESPLCEIVDAGNDKEGADNKIKNNMELFSANAHCKHIVLAASGDKSYIGFLRQFVVTGQKCERLTLVKALPFPLHLEKLAGDFKTTVFEKIFRSSPLTLQDTHKQSQQVDVKRPTPSPPMSYASTAAKASLDTAEAGLNVSKGGSASGSQPETSEGPKRLKINFNKFDQRIDTPLGHYDGNILSGLKHKKLCNRHYLSKCRFRDDECHFGHDACLSKIEKQTLKKIARLSSCKPWCTDDLCVASHHCPNGVNCQYGNKCLFEHGVDTQIVRSRTVSLDD